MEMPKASFDTWVRDTRLVSYDDGLFTIGVRNEYARDWLESRLSSTATRLLMGIMNRTVDVSFVVDSLFTADDDREGDNDEGETEPETAEVQVVHRLRYDEVVLPERIVALPGYFSRLIPEIGARNAWLYIGWRAGCLGWPPSGQWLQDPSCSSSRNHSFLGLEPTDFLSGGRGTFHLASPLRPCGTMQRGTPLDTRKGPARSPPA